MNYFFHIFYKHSLLQYRLNDPRINTSRIGFTTQTTSMRIGYGPYAQVTFPRKIGLQLNRYTGREKILGQGGGGACILFAKNVSPRRTPIVSDVPTKFIIKQAADGGIQALKGEPRLPNPNRHIQTMLLDLQSFPQRGWYWHVR
jgi:hypothetical protein